MSRLPRLFFFSILIASASLLRAQTGLAAPRTPTIEAVTFSAPPVAGTTVTMSAVYSDIPSTAGEKCALVIKDIGQIELLPTGAALATNGTFSTTYKFTTAGRYSLQVRCEDVNTGAVSGVVEGNLSFADVAAAGVGAPTADVTAPTVSEPTPLTATIGQNYDVVITYDDAGSGVGGCTLLLPSVGASASMSLTGTSAHGTATQRIQSGMFTTNFTITLYCTDLSGNQSPNMTRTVVVSPAGTVTAPADTVAPTVSEPTPLTATIGQDYNFGITYDDAGSGVGGCTILLPSVGASAPMTLTGTPTHGTATQRITSSLFSTNFTITIYCTDLSGNQSPSMTRTVVVSPAGTVATPAPVTPTDTIAPTLKDPSPLTAVVGVPYTVSVIYTDAGSGVGTCTLHTTGVSGGPYSPTMSGSPVDGAVSFTIPGSAFIAGNFTVDVHCTDRAGNSAQTGIKTVFVALAPVPLLPPDTDRTAPEVGATSPSMAVINTATTFTATYTDSVGVSQCFLFVDDASVGTMARSSGSNTAGIATLSYTFLTSGPHTLRTECVDAAGNRGKGGTATMNVSAVSVTTSSADTERPTVSAASVGASVANSPVTVYAAFADTVGVSACYLYVDGTNVGVMTVSGGGAISGIAAREYTFTTTGSHAVRAECVDAAGNRGVGGASSIVVATPTASGSVTPIISVNPTAPVITRISPSLVGVNAETSYAVTFTSNVGVVGCSLYVNGAYVGAMGLSGTVNRGAANYRHIFSAPGTYEVHAECVDDARTRGIGPAAMVTVSTNPTTQAASPSVATTRPEQGTLIKLVCPDGAGVNDPCKAVYFYGHDGYRHAFPHERIFFSWYTGFDGVIEVTDAVLASIPLGNNVTYRPGVRLVKFTTVPKVYVVTRGGVLRWITTAELAATLYGQNWAQNVHDLTDAYYSNYTFGADITSAAQYSPATELSAVATIDENR